MTDGREHERLRWACRRGMLELDLLLHEFMERDFPQLSGRERALLRRLLELPDNELLEYCYDRARPGDPELAALARKIAR